MPMKFASRIFGFQDTPAEDLSKVDGIVRGSMPMVGARGRRWSPQVVWFRLPIGPLTRVATDSILEVNTPHLNHASLRRKSFGS